MHRCIAACLASAAIVSVSVAASADEGGAPSPEADRVRLHFTADHDGATLQRR